MTVRDELHVPTETRVLNLPAALAADADAVARGDAPLPDDPAALDYSVTFSDAVVARVRVESRHGGVARAVTTWTRGGEDTRDESASTAFTGRRSVVLDGVVRTLVVRADRDAVIPSVSDGEPERAPASEVSYLDLVTRLRDDVSSDEAMPSETRRRALELVDELARALVPYSA